MSLKDESNLSAKRDKLTSAGTIQILSQYGQFAVLDRPECTNERQQSGFSGPAWSGHNDDFARKNGQIVIKQNLLAKFSGAEKMLEIGRANRGFDILGCTDTSARVEKCRSLNASRQHRDDNPLLEFENNELMKSPTHRLQCNLF